MFKLAVYSEKGVKKGSTNLPKNFIEVKNLPLLAQAIRVYQDRQHPGLSQVKTRAEVNISKRKIYRQKGTGGARHGAKSAPIFAGGGVTHGPKGFKRILTLSQKHRVQALNVALALKNAEGKVFVVDGMPKLEKTKEVAALINKITKDLKESVSKVKFTIALSEKNNSVYKSIRNLKGVEVMPFRNLNANKVFFGGNIIIDKDALAESSNSSVEKKSEKEIKVKQTSQKTRTPSMVKKETKKPAKVKPDPKKRK